MPGSEAWRKGAGKRGVEEGCRKERLRVLCQPSIWVVNVGVWGGGFTTSSRSDTGQIRIRYLFVAVVGGGDGVHRCGCDGGIGIG